MRAMSWSATSFAGTQRCRIRKRLAVARQIVPVRHTNGIRSNDPLYQFHHHANLKAKPLSDREMDRMIYGG